MLIEKLNYHIIVLFTMIKLFNNDLVKKTKLNFQTKELQFNGWFLVLIAVVLALGATVYLGLMSWCILNGHGSFTGAWKYAKKGYVMAKCGR